MTDKKPLVDIDALIEEAVYANKNHIDGQSKEFWIKVHGGEAQYKAWQLRKLQKQRAETNANRDAEIAKLRSEFNPVDLYDKLKEDPDYEHTLPLTILRILRSSLAPEDIGKIAYEREADFSLRPVKIINRIYRHDVESAIRALSHPLDDCTNIMADYELVLHDHKRAPLEEILKGTVSNSAIAQDLAYAVGILQETCAPKESTYLIGQTLGRMLCNMIPKTQASAITSLLVVEGHQELAGYIMRTMRRRSVPLGTILPDILRHVKPDEAYYLLRRAGCSKPQTEKLLSSAYATLVSQIKYKK